ncbi:holin [Streptococcus halichoeri]|nr:holin [Streptococcus halichoeri]
MSQLQQRLSRQSFWIALISLVMMLVDNIAHSYFRVCISDTLNMLEQTFCIVLTILLFLGFLTNKPD